MTPKKIISQTKTITFFVNTLSGGGTEKVVLQLANHFAEQGHQVSLILAKKVGQYLKQLDKRVVVYELNTFLNQKPLIKKVLTLLGLFVFFQILSISKLVKKKKTKTIVCFGEWPNLIGPLIKFLLPKKTIRVIISERNAKTFITNPEAYRLKSHLKALAKLATKKADRILACSKDVASSLAQVSHLKDMEVTIINNPVDLDNIIHLAEKDVDYPFGTNNKAKVLVASGRLHKQKDYSTMLKAFALVKKQINVRLLILGEGGLKKELQNQCDELNITNDVAFVGFVDNPYKYITKSDLFIHSAIYEGFPNVIAEALACGLNVVSTNCNGVDEILQGGKYGTIVPKENPEALANAIIGAVKEKRSKEFQRTGVASYSIKAIAESYLNIIQHHQ